MRRLHTVPRSRALIGLLLLAVAGTGLIAWYAQDPTELPSDPPQPLPDGNTPVPPPETGNTFPANPGSANGSTGSGSTGNGGTADAGPVRIAVTGTTEDTRPCELRVRVLYEQDGMPRPVTFTEVTVSLEQDLNASGLGRTDARGVAEFAFVGGSGLTVMARSATGGSQTAILSADELVELTVVVVPKVMATGKVIDASNVGVAEADIVLLRWPPDNHSPGDVWRIGRSGRDGSFRIPVRHGGRIGATHADYASSALFLLRPKRSAAAPTSTEVFKLVLQRDTSRVLGTIRDAAGGTIANAVIELQTTNKRPDGAELAGPPNRVHSDRAGNFAVMGLPPGEARWYARKVGHGWNQGTTTLIERGNNRLEIQLPTAASVTGVVVERQSGKPVAGATVSAGTPGTLCSRGTRSAADGSYRLPDLGVGPTKLLATHDYRLAETTLELSAGKESTWRARLTSGGNTALRGTVVDVRGRALSDYTVIVRQKGLDPLGMQTDGTGAFEIPLQQVQGLDVRVFAPGRPPTSFADLVRRGVDARTVIKLIVENRETTVVAGRVLDSAASGAPATIGCWHNEFREYARFKANEDGAFDIQCPVGTVHLTIEHASHVAHTTGSMQLQPGVRTDLGTIRLALGGGLFGTVMGPGGTPPPNCDLKLRVANGPELQAEYIGGSYRFSEVPPGNHSLFVQGEGISGESFPITITAGVDLPRDVEVQQGLYCRVRVAVPPRGGSRVTLALRAPDSPTRWYATSTVQRDGPRQTGWAVFETWMAAGSYEAIAVTPEGHEARATLQYQGAASDPFVLRVAPR